jgi:fatty acid desaturase
MDWNDMRDKLRKIKAPGMQFDPPKSGGGDDLIAKLRAHDAEERERLRRSRVLFWVATGGMGFGFVGVCLLPPGPLHVPRVVYQGALLAAFIYSTLALREKMWKLSRVDYTQPAQSFLREAEQRYVFMRTRDYIVMLVGLLALGLASAPYVVGLFLSRYVDPRHSSAVILLYCLFYLFVCVMGLYFTYRNWRRDKAPVLAEIRRREAALQEEGGPA